MNTTLLAKQELRRALLATRRQLTRMQAISAAEAVATRLRSLPEWQRATRIGGYRAVGGEIPLTPLCDAAAGTAKIFYYPKIQRLGAGLMWYLPLGGKPLVANRYGIPEPNMPVHQAIRPSQLDIILLPLVAFDLTGHRLGMGGGYYDRLLAGFPATARPLTIGLAHEFQAVDSLPVAHWDHPLDWVITPRRCHDFRSG